MRFTLKPLFFVAIAVPALAGAQEPARPSRPPTAPTPVQPARPPREPLPQKFFDPHWLPDKVELAHELEMLKFNAKDMKLAAKEVELHMKDFAFLDVERMKIDAEELKLHAMDMAREIDVEKIRREAESSLRNIDVDRLRFEAEEAVKRAQFIAPHFDLYGKVSSEKFLEGRPRPAWASEDPADSLYRVAREALNRGEYRRAAQLFNELITKYRQSQYAVHSAYWEAFARYRAGGTDDLRAARKIMDDWQTQFAALRSEGSVDAAALRARVVGALAQRGDEAARREVEKGAVTQNGGSCDREDVSVRAEALGALSQMDPAAALPVAKRILERRDECTVELRRRALYVIGRQGAAEAVPIIIEVARNDTDAGIRSEAMRWLPRVAGDNAIPQLEELLRTGTDEQTQRSAVSALGSISSESARRAIRTIIERNDASERIRMEAILTIARERDGRTVTAEEVTYLRALYGKLETVKLKESVLTALSRIEGRENDQFLLSVARNTNETPALRASALQRLGRMEAVSVNDIAKLYDVADSRSLREQILYALGQRKEPEAIEKVIEIAKKDTDPQVRRTAINVLMRSNNDRAKQFMKEFFDK